MSAEIVSFVAAARFSDSLARRRHVARIRRFAEWLGDYEQRKDIYRWQGGSRKALEYLIAERAQRGRQA